MYSLLFVIGTNAASFIAGALFAFVITKIVKKEMKPKALLVIAVSILWVGSMALDTINQVQNTSWFLHAFFGSLAFSMYPEAFDKFYQLVRGKNN